MRTNLPREMDFVIEAQNAARTVQEFSNIRTSLYIPAVIHASKRVLIMEYIQGGRVDDLPYLAKHGIDRNKVAIELSRIFNQMVFIHGWFHAVSAINLISSSQVIVVVMGLQDPHPGTTSFLRDYSSRSAVVLGNLLIRPAASLSRSPYNFEIVLLDHGLYFDLSDELRFNYAKLWLALIASASPTTIAERKKYAQLVGNIGPELVRSPSCHNSWLMILLVSSL